MHLNLLDPSQVQPEPQLPPAGASQVNISLPPCWGAADVDATARVYNRSADYKVRQATLRHQLADRKRKAEAEGAVAGASAAAPAEEPDSQAVYEARWLEMRDAAMSDLHAMLCAMLRQAVRSRGTSDLSFAPAAAAAGGQPAGGA